MRITYNASPTAAKLHASDKFIRGFKGPVGNGKSVACLQEAKRISFEQWPNSEGVRLSRGVIVRNTNPELRTTTLKTWKQWLPEKYAPVRMNPIITSHMVQKLPDGTTVDMEVLFLAMDRDDDVGKLLSLECTWIFLNEARELPYSVVKAARERVGRYPSEIDGYQDVHKDGKLIFDAPKVRDEEGKLILSARGEIQFKPCRRKAIIMDTNPPEDDHWWYQLAEEGCLRKAKNKAVAREETKRIFEFFDGPPPLFEEEDGTYTTNPLAENVEHLDGGFQYYLDMIAGNTPDHINVMVLGNYGTITEGRPVYPTYSDVTHCSDVKVIPGLPICLGWDFGLTPACVIAQLTPENQMRVIDELFSEDLDVHSFARDVVKPHLQQNYADYRIGFSLADPAGNNRGEGEGKASIRILNDMYKDSGMETLDMGFITEPAPTNDPTLRIDAVNRFLNRMVYGDPAYMLDRKCSLLRKGKKGAYCYKRVASSGSEEKYRDVPDKNKSSHTADAEQYIALGFAGGFVTDGYDEQNEDHYDHSTGRNPVSGY